MHDDLQHADAQLDKVTSHLHIWKPGRYAGHLFVGFTRAQSAVAALNDVDRPFHAERLQRLTDRAGIVLAPSTSPAAPIATIMAAATQMEVDTALADVEPRVEIRAEAPETFTV